MLNANAGGSFQDRCHDHGGYAGQLNGTVIYNDGYTINKKEEGSPANKTATDGVPIIKKENDRGAK